MAAITTIELKASLNFTILSHDDIFCQLDHCNKFEKYCGIDLLNKLIADVLAKKSTSNVNVDTKNGVNKLLNNIIFKEYSTKNDDGKQEDVLGCSLDNYKTLIVKKCFPLNVIIDKKPTPLTYQIKLQEIPLNILWAVEFKKTLVIDVPVLNEAIKSRIGAKVWDSLYNFQQECLRYMIARKCRGLIADDMGLGKTAESLSIISFYKAAWPCLILTTAKCRPGWVNEIVKFLNVDPLRIITVESGVELKKIINSITPNNPNDGQVVNTTKCKLLNYDFWITSFSLVSTHLQLFQQLGFKVLIVDESQATKHYSSKRTQAITQLTKEVKYALYLSGTPMEKPKMLFPTMNALYPDVFPDYPSFRDRYCDPQEIVLSNGMNSKKIIKDDGRTLSGELHLVLTSLLMIRRLKDKVNIKLPPKTRIYYTLDPDKKQAKVIEKVMSKVDVNTMSVNKDLEQDYGKNNAFMAAYRKISKVKLPLVQDLVTYLIQDTQRLKELTTMPENSEGKIPNYDVEDHQEPGHQEKIILFGHHRAMLDGVKEVLEEHKINYVRLDGRVSKESDVKAIIDTFQNDNSCRVALLSITSASAGLTLTAGTIVIFLEMHPSAEAIIQAECRAHRIGQTKPVKCLYLIFPESIEQMLWQLINKKYKSLTAIVDGNMKSFYAKRIDLRQNKRENVDDDDNSSDEDDEFDKPIKKQRIE